MRQLQIWRDGILCLFLLENFIRQISTLSLWLCVIWFVVQQHQRFSAAKTPSKHKCKPLECCWWRAIKHKRFFCQHSNPILNFSWNGKKKSASLHLSSFFYRLFSIFGIISIYKCSSVFWEKATHVPPHLKNIILWAVQSLCSKKQQQDTHCTITCKETHTHKSIFGVPDCRELTIKPSLWVIHTRRPGVRPNAQIFYTCHFTLLLIFWLGHSTASILTKQEEEHHVCHRGPCSCTDWPAEPADVHGQKKKDRWRIAADTWVDVKWISNSMLDCLSLSLYVNRKFSRVSMTRRQFYKKKIKKTGARSNLYSESTFSL